MIFQIGADGANSLVRKKLMSGITVHAKEYQQFGVVGTVTFSQNLPDGNATAYQKFLPTGPIALLPLSSNKSSLVWTLPPKTAKELVKFDPKSFSKILNANLSDRKHMELIDAAVAQIRHWLPSGDDNSVSSKHVCPRAVKGAFINAIVPLNIKAFY